MNQNGAPVAHACGEHAVGYGTGKRLTDLSNPANASGNLKPENEAASIWARAIRFASSRNDVKLNGKLTLGENIADNAGVRLTLLAYLASAVGRTAQTMDGFTPEQRLFVSFGQTECQNRRPEYDRLMAQTDPHSAPRYRVNGVVSNMPEFQRAFSCKSDAPMVRENACREW